MSLDSIKAIPVGHLARGDCLLLLWTCGWANGDRAGADGRKLTAAGKAKAKPARAPLLVRLLATTASGAAKRLKSTVKKERAVLGS
jgi:hypothetical protein